MFWRTQATRVVSSKFQASGSEAWYGLTSRFELPTQSLTLRSRNSKSCSSTLAGMVLGD